MRKRDIEQKIIQEVKSTTPNIIHKIDLQSIEIIEPASPFYKRFFKPVLIPSLVIAVLVLLPIIILNIDTTTPGPPNNQVVDYNNREESYTLSALSAISLLNQIEDETTLNNTKSMMFLSQSFTNSGPTLLLDSHLSQLNRNLAMIEPLIGQKDTIQFSTVLSELEDYTYKIIFSNKDLNNQTIEYIMHYNEIKEDDDTYLIDGIMMIENVNYFLEGELTTDGDDFELEVIAHHPSEEDTYVEIFQEVSQTEHTLEYIVIKNDEILYESILNFEIDDDEIFIEIYYEKGELQYTFEITKIISNNIPVYYIEYEIETSTGEESGEIIVETVHNTLEDTYYYRYRIESDNTIATRFIKRIGLIK